MTTVFLAPAPINTTQFLPGTNNPANGAQLFSYITGTSTKQNMYTTSAGNVTWANPLVLDSGGNIPTSKEIWIPQGLPARFVLAPSNDTDPPSSPYWTIDNISGVNDVTTTSSGEWTVFTPTATFSGATSFTVVGDQTAIFTVGRRLKTTNTAGTIYSTITVSSFAAGTTTVTVVNDSGSLDAGLSAVSYGVLSTPNGSVPWTQVRSTGLDFSGGSGVTTSALTVTSTSSFLGSASYSGVAHNDAQTSVSSSAAPNIWSGGNVINYTGTTSASTFTAAPQAGAIRTLLLSSTVAFTSSATLGIATAESTHTGVSGDAIDVFATSASFFSLYPRTQVINGTWTPNVGGNATYTIQSGITMKIGNLVFFQGNLAVNSIGTGSTSRIFGFPFSSNVNVPVYMGHTGTLATTVVSIIGSLGEVGLPTTIRLLSRISANANDFENPVIGNNTQIVFGGVLQAN